MNPLLRNLISQKNIHYSDDRNSKVDLLVQMFKINPMPGLPFLRRGNEDEAF